MIDVKDFFNTLRDQGINNFCGVPDSLLKNICAYIVDNTEPSQHLITANEGSAVALAVGHYISTGKLSLVYMQNSGFGNAINPLLSLADSRVYGIPMLILVGWRGEPGVIDEPQHIKQGAVMEQLLEACGINTVIIDSETKNINNVLKESIELTKATNQPLVILARKDTFGPYILKKTIPDIAPSSRESAIEKILDSCSETSDIFVSTTGMASREMFEIRVKKNQTHKNDFLTVGSMGHANMIALGIAKNTNKTVFCIDGDGASIMHLGNLTSIGLSGAKNLIHIIINNASHDSVGGQPTAAHMIDLPEIGKSCGYTSSESISKTEGIAEYIHKLKLQPGPHLLEIKVKKGSRKDLGRPTSTPNQNKEALMTSFK